MAKVIVNGSVSEQAQAGEPITVTFKRPDGTTENLTTTTKTDKSFTLEKVYGTSGVYTFTVIANKTSDYDVATFGPINFTITLATRTVTATVQVVPA